MKSTFALVAGLVLALTIAAGAAATTKPKPWQWTNAQARSALMRQSEDFYLENINGHDTPRDLTTATCRGTGKQVARRFVTFTCTGSYQRGVADPIGTVRVVAKTRKTGGLCWSVSPAPIPSGCLTPGKRAEGNAGDAWVAVYKSLNDRNVQGSRCLAHGSGFFTCTWSNAEGAHSGTVVFNPSPVVKVLS